MSLKKVWKQRKRYNGEKEQTATEKHREQKERTKTFLEYDLIRSSAITSW